MEPQVNSSHDSILRTVAVADAISDAEKSGVIRERERCMKIVDLWCYLYSIGSVSASQALLGIAGGITKKGGYRHVPPVAECQFEFGNDKGAKNLKSRSSHNFK